MASIIKLKRSSTQGSIPETLQVGEIAVNLFDRRLYVGNSAGVTAVGGEAFKLTSDTVTTSGDGAYIKLLGETTPSTNSIALLAGEGLDVTLESNGSITFSAEDATTSNKGVASFATADFGVSSGAVSLNDAVVKSVSGDSGSATPSGHGFTIAGTDGQGIDTSATGSTVTITAKDATASQKGVASFNSSFFDVASGAVSLTDNGVTNAKLENAGYTLATDGTGEDLSVDLGETININEGEGINVTFTANTITIAAEDASTSNKGVASFSSNDFAVSSGVVTIKNDGVTLGTQTTGNYVAGISGTSNEITVSGSGSEGASVTIGLPDDVTIAGQLTVNENISVAGNTAVGGDLTVDGNLTVEGAVTYISSSTVNVDDSMLKLSANNAGDTVDTGVYGMYVDGVTTKYSGFFRDASDDTFKFYTGLQAEPTTTVNTSGTGYALAQVDAVIDGGTY